jgi:hypothetical protein
MTRPDGKKNDILVFMAAMAFAVILVVAAKISNSDPIESVCAQYWRIADMLYAQGQEPTAQFIPSGATHIVVIWAEPYDPENPDKNRVWTSLAISEVPNTTACTIGGGDHFKLFRE